MDAATGKVAGAKNPRKWGNFFDFRANYLDPPQASSKLPAVGITLPDGTVVTSDDPELPKMLSRGLGREVAFAEARRHGQATDGRRVLAGHGGARLPGDGD